jgi:MbtH protein
MAEVPGLTTEAVAHRVVVNDEEQYSIWPVDRDLPLGWHEEGTRGGKEECLDHIERIWVDMRPLSLRNRLVAAQD